MMESIKTVVLAILIAASLLQSYFVVYSRPDFEVESEEAQKYIETDLDGTPEKLENLLIPQQLILHFGNGEHTVLYPDNTFFRSHIFPVIKQRSFTGLNEISLYSVDLEVIRDNNEGVEIRFDFGVPLNVLGKIMQIQGDTSIFAGLINGMWIYNDKEKGEVRAFLTTDNNRLLYEITKADLTVADVKTFVGYGELMPRYKTVNGSYYYPEGSIEVVRQRFRYTTINTGDMQKNLFFDPEITRSLPQRDGTMIYSDGKRGLQVNPSDKWMIYTDPVASLEGRNDMMDNLYAAVQFVNQHGGWNGKYMFRTMQDYSIGKNTFLFQQYYGSYPIISPRTKFGEIRVVMEKGVVTSYERSFIRLYPVSERKEIQRLPGGDQLKEKLNLRYDDFLIKAVIPAYRPEVLKDEVELVPIWAVELIDGSFQEL